MKEELVGRKRLEIFPTTVEITGSGLGPNDELTLAGHSLAGLAQEYGTPLYLYDQATMDGAVTEYRTALDRHYPGSAEITYAGKAYLSATMACWAFRSGLFVDCTGAGEIAIAVAAGVRREQILVHGVNKSDDDLGAAIESASIIVVDNLDEMERIAERSRSQRKALRVWLRIRPGLAVETHAYRQTGQIQSKFGMSREEALRAIEIGRDSGMNVSGLHFHQGSHFHDPEPVGEGIMRILETASFLRNQAGWEAEEICPGGGWGIPYHEDDLPHPPIEAYVAHLSATLVRGCREEGLRLPRLHVEPGRSLVGRAGVALYRVGTVKTSGERRWYLIDGGMADNIRPALYGARYCALPVLGPMRPARERVWIGGPYCESGDVLIEELSMAALERGDLLAIPASGAYHLMMSSNYNGALRPAVLWLNGRGAHLIQRRETPSDLLRRDGAPPLF